MAETVNHFSSEDSPEDDDADNKNASNGLLFESLEEDEFEDLDSVVIEEGQINFSIDNFNANILVVEDDQYSAMDYGNALDGYGFKVSYAFDSEQAVKLIYLHGLHFSKIILDIRMYFGRYLSPEETQLGKRTGACLLSLMRDYAPGAIFVALTNSSDAFDEARFLSNDGFQFCEKKDFPPHVFAKYIFLLSYEDADEGASNGRGFKRGMLKAIFDAMGRKQITTLEVTMGDTIKGDKVMGDKYQAEQVAAQGRNAQVHSAVFEKFVKTCDGNFDINEFSRQLTILREAMAASAREPQDYVQIGHVANAETEAANGDAPKALEHLKSAGKKTLDIAEKIGIGVVVAAIKSALGI